MTDETKSKNEVAHVRSLDMKKKPGRKPLFGRPMTVAERVQRHRLRHREKLQWEDAKLSDEMHEFFGEPHLKDANL
jgi:hypothetical protein